MKIGIFGGTFNPIHYGHLRAAEDVREKLGLDQILFIPSGKPPLKTEELAGAVHRYEMTRLAVEGNSLFRVLDIECFRPGKSFTVNTMEILLERHQGSELYFILGIDAFLELPKWRQTEKLLSLVNFVVLSRPEYQFTELLVSPYLDIKKSSLRSLDTGRSESFSLKLRTGKELVLLRIAPFGVSSTDIRRRVKSGLAIKYMLPEKVEFYIISNKLYKQPDRKNKKQLFPERRQ
ncbi:MAG: nicotinate-nucleotide adenylyltransferase [Nitrospirota bacterium]|nr:nicotinate-nucleotide adenylyltransferase [Nitrospirota bacterium]